jgi:4-diphosphocytidyl-2-C-methyl-D-erythritol kinase
VFAEKFTLKNYFCFMILFPPAKINLGLNILQKRTDGYHDLETCMVPIPVFDVLEITHSEHFEFIQTGRTIGGSTDMNLCEKAYELLKNQFPIGPVRIHLRKQIPIGAGLGGGSADATYTLLALNNLFGLQLRSDELKNLAAQLGSDCPFFVHSDAQLATGRGEVLESIELNLPTLYLVLLNPEIHVGTKDAYAGVSPKPSGCPVKEILKKPLSHWQELLINDFERSVFELHPKIGQLKQDLLDAGAVFAAMSGSGSSVFGLFLSETSAMTISSEHLIYRGLFKK